MIRQGVKRKQPLSSNSNSGFLSDINESKNIENHSTNNYAKTLIINNTINDPNFPLIKQYTRETKSSSADFNNFLTVYSMPPIHHSEITLQEFETFGIDRLKLLMDLNYYHKTLNLSIKEIIEAGHFKQFMLKYMKDTKHDLKQSIIKDYYGHYILRLCFLKDNENMDLFCSLELMLLKLKFASIVNKNDKIQFLKDNSSLLNITDNMSEDDNLITLSQIQDQKLKDKYTKFYGVNTNNSVDFETSILRLKFTKLIDILPSRTILLYKGYLYIPEHMQFNYLANVYSKNLKKELLKIVKYKLNNLSVNESDRLIPIINHLNNNGSVLNNYNRKDFTNSSNGDELLSDEVYLPDTYNNYPLCMQNLLTGLRNDSHLKYQGRQQLSLFLKECGLNIEEALKFWQKSFQQKYGLEEFNKNYKYNFRHNYGLEGSRINFKPWDCSTILNKEPPSSGMYHGCPFRDWNKVKLSGYLSKSKNYYTKEELSKYEVNTILDFKDKNDYMMCCTKYFELTKDTLPHNELITHPNLYYQRSKELDKRKKIPETVEINENK
ncbi:hypothetical protein ACO0SA_002248 [Hanseniaspora valbyensis]